MRNWRSIFDVDIYDGDDIMRKIYLIRHAKTQANLEGRFCGVTDSKIVEPKEKIQEKLQSKLPVEEMGKVFSSPSARAFETAGAIAEHVTIVEDLREIDFGLFENNTLQEIIEKFPNEFEKWSHAEGDYQFPEGDLFSNFFERVNGAFSKICAENPNDNITIFSHGGVIQAILSNLLVKDSSLFWKFKIENCGVTKILQDGEHFTFEKMNY